MIRFRAQAWIAAAMRALLFLALLGTFAWRNHWYPAYWLTLKVEPRGSLSYRISWDVPGSRDAWEGFTTNVEHLWIRKSEGQTNGGAEWSVAMLLPQRPIRRLKLEPLQAGAPGRLLRATVSTDWGPPDQLFGRLYRSSPAPFVFDLPLVRRENSYVIENISLPHRFNVTLFVIQALTAALITYAAVWFLGELRRAGGIKNFSWAGDRKLFTISCASSSAVFMIWLLGQWPGGLMHDSLWSWDQSVAMWFDSWHPPLYALYLVALRQIYDSPATVAVFQILATAALGGAMLLYAKRSGVGFGILIPGQLVFMCSVPIGLMNIWVTKDVPNSLAVVIAGFWVFRKRRIRVEKGNAEPVLRHTPLFILFLCAGELRYTGAFMYIVLATAVFIVLNRKDAFYSVLMLCASFIIGRAMRLAIPTVVAMQQMSILVNPVIGIMREPRYFSEHPREDRDCVNRYLDYETALKRYDPVNVEPLRAGDVTHYDKITAADLKKFRMFTVELILNNLPRFLATRLEMMLSASGFSHRAQLYFSLIRDPANREYYQSPNTSSIHQSPVSAGLFRAENHLIDRVSEPHGFWTWRTVVWDVTVPTFLLAAACLIKRPASAYLLYALPQLGMLAALFLLMPVATWRYFYSIYLAAVLLLPFLWSPNTAPGVRRGRGSPWLRKNAKPLQS